MRSTGLGLAWCLLLAWLSPAHGSEIALPDDPLQGRVLFTGRHCHQCHGITGSHPGIGPDLGEGRFSGTFLELGAALWNHVPGMSVTFDVTDLPWPRLSDSETTQLVVFLNFIDYLGHPGGAERGQAIFQERGCSTCHAVGGGEAHLGPDLADLESFASPLHVAQMIWNHGPEMLASMQSMGISRPTFEEDDLADMSAFIRQRSAPGPRERMLLAPGNPNAGAELFASKGCATCHGLRGRGGDGGPDLAQTDLHRSAAGIVGTMWNHAWEMSQTMHERGVGWPEFRDTELADLVSFLYFLPFEDPAGDVERGAQLFRTRSCAECHGEGESGEQAPDLEGTDAASSPAALVTAMWNHAPTMKKAILAEGKPWPELTGQDLRDLLAYLSH